VGIRDGMSIYEKIHEMQGVVEKRHGVSGRRNDNVGWNEDV